MLADVLSRRPRGEAITAISGSRPRMMERRERFDSEKTVCAGAVSNRSVMLTVHGNVTFLSKPIFCALALAGVPSVNRRHLFHRVLCGENRYGDIFKNAPIKQTKTHSALPVSSLSCRARVISAPYPSAGFYRR